MLHNNPIETESHIAYQMLVEATANTHIKRVLHEIALTLRMHVLAPIRELLINTDSFSALPKPYQDMLENLAAEHTAERYQYGAVMPHIASSRLMLSTTMMIKLIDIQDKHLSNIATISHIDDIARVMKIIVELGLAYYAGPSTWHQSNFANINQLVFPTREEIDMRVFRSELNQPAQLALTHGIGTDTHDLGLLSEGKGYNTGKSTFGIVSMKARLSQLCDAYDNHHLDKHAEQMAYYQIPLLKADRESLDFYAAKWETWFEKLIKNPATGTSQPLIASVSRATGRAIVTLQDLGAFNHPDGSFNFDKAQIFSNCMMGFIVHAGHHSITEVAEVYNRLLDYIAIQELETKGPSETLVETEMPYYKIGCYASFFNRAYVNNLRVEKKPENSGAVATISKK